VSNPQVKQPFSFQSDLFNDSVHKIIGVLYGSATGEMEWGVRGVSEKGHLSIFSKANQ
jgi:hypothetical protein